MARNIRKISGVKRRTVSEQFQDFLAGEEAAGRKWGSSAVAKIIGTKRQNIDNLRNGFVEGQIKYLAGLSDFMRTTPDILLSGEYRWAPPDSSGAAPIGPPHRVRLTAEAFDPPKTSIAEVGVSGVPVGKFVCEVEDDAMAPSFPRGRQVIFEARAAPMLGYPVIVRDRHGQLHMRLYAQSTTPGRWIAQATAPGYVSLAGPEDELTILASTVGVLFQ